MTELFYIIPIIAFIILGLCFIGYSINVKQQIEELNKTILRLRRDRNEVEEEFRKIKTEYAHFKHVVWKERQEMQEKKEK